MLNPDRTLHAVDAVSADGQRIFVAFCDDKNDDQTYIKVIDKGVTTKLTLSPNALQILLGLIQLNESNRMVRPSKYKWPV
jgi:predicted aspartyl protease